MKAVPGASGAEPEAGRELAKAKPRAGAPGCCGAVPQGTRQGEPSGADPQAERSTLI